MSGMIRPYPSRRWRAELFSSKQARSGGVIRRNRRDVAREMGLDALELEVRRRGWHMLESGDQIVVICSPEPFRLIC